MEFTRLASKENGRSQREKTAPWGFTDPFHPWGDSRSANSTSDVSSFNQSRRELAGLKLRTEIHRGYPCATWQANSAMR